MDVHHHHRSNDTADFVGLVALAFAYLPFIIPGGFAFYWAYRRFLLSWPLATLTGFATAGCTWAAVAVLHATTKYQRKRGSKWWLLTGGAVMAMSR